MSPTFDQIDKFLLSLIEKYPQMKEVLIFYKEFLKIQLKIKSNLSFPSFHIKEDVIEEKVKERRPFIELYPTPDLNLEAIIPLADFLFLLIKKRGPAVAIKIRGFEEFLKDRQQFFNLSRQYLNHNAEFLNDFALNHDLDGTLLIFLLKNSLKPLMETIAEEISKTYDFSHWFHPFCPICGAFPAFSLFTPPKKENDQLLFFKGKKRFLFCSLCNFNWPFPRLTCPFCQIENKKELGYFYVEADEKGYRVDVCNDCRSYIKAIDREYITTPKELLFLEDIKTFHLDLLAEREGYCKKAEGIFSL